MANKQTPRLVFVTGGVLSGLGKGITAASLGALFKSRGYSVNIQKLDPYLNVDAGTLNPGEHGECFVTDDGAETDLDIGHYERFLDRNLNQSSSVMSGRILRQLIEDERAGKYLGQTVQVVPHFTEAIARQVLTCAKGFDIHMVEIGGTVGDYESPAFFEAIRGLKSKYKTVCVQVVYLPFLTTSREVKTKPAQNAVRSLMGLGLVPDVLIGRTDHDEVKDSIARKLSTTTGVDVNAIALLPTAKTIYEVPLILHQASIDRQILRLLDLPIKSARLTDWRSLVKKAKTDYKVKLKIALVAKYLDNEDSYYSVVEALRSAGWHEGVGIEISWVDAQMLTKQNVKNKLSKFDGIVVPGGFGTRGLEGKIVTASYAMRHKVPYLGLCLGLQMAVVAAARDLLGLKEANSTELNPNTKYPVIDVMHSQTDKLGTGGTMRLGSYPCVLADGSLARKLYQRAKVDERHRHRYEVNNLYRDDLEKVGLWFSGLSPDGKLAEIVELKNHPFFIASQFHPELKSRPNRPHPMFQGFVTALQKRLR